MFLKYCHNFLPLLYWILLCAFSYGEENVSLPAQTEKEECVELSPGAVLTYRFNTTLPVKFDLHSHFSETDALYLDNSFSTKKRGPKRLTIDREGVYCLHWKNKYNKDATLNYKITITER